MTKQDIIKHLARKHKLSYEQVEEAVQSQFYCTAYVFKRGEAETIRLPYFGKFSVSPKRLENLKKNNSGQGLRKIET